MAEKERFKINTWYDVPFKYDRRSKKHGESSSNVKITKVFVLNLPEGCSSADLVHVMKGFGVIQGTYIARKYDKLGKRFGFVSFINIEDPLRLEEDLKDVWIGSYKLYAVLARFVNGMKVQGKETKVWKPVSDIGADLPVDVNGESDKVKDSNGPSRVGTRSFRDTLLNMDTGKEVLDITIKDEVVVRNPWNGLGLLGKVKDFSSLNRLRSWLSESVNYKVTIKYLGGFSIILVYGSIEEKNWFFDKKRGVGQGVCFPGCMGRTNMGV
ncbi:putative RNA recognition motif domain, nucleotide-binding alpha-beta plait domain superfamily [Helianthus annuus]|nr:putative RNA recognition motif domain, nucleotide-binding alpha-beta plait domain superfamily [Helianthus annuus]